MSADREISATDPDWSRERIRSLWDPSRKLLRALRRHQAAQRRGGPVGRVMARYWALQHLFWSTVTQAEIQLRCEIGGGLLMPHPNGIVIHPDVRIGPNALIMQQATLGANHGAVPTIGGHVDIGPGARVLGGIVVGDHALIGANAVVLSDVPAYAVVAGIPARVIGDRRPPASPCRSAC